MSATEFSSVITPDDLAETQRLVDLAANGDFDPASRREALEWVKRHLEEFRRRHGVVDLAVELIREVRDGG